MSNESRIRGLQREIAMASDLLAKIPMDLLTMPSPVRDFGTIGEQYRHIINFIEILYRDYTTGLIDFTKRDRDPLLETNKEYIDKRLKLIREQLDELRTTDPGLDLTSVYMPSARGEPVLDKVSFGALINQVNEHTNHHIAMIRILAAHHGVSIKSLAGVATSTRAHNRF